MTTEMTVAQVAELARQLQSLTTAASTSRSETTRTLLATHFASHTLQLAALGQFISTAPFNASASRSKKHKNRKQIRDGDWVASETKSAHSATVMSKTIRWLRQAEKEHRSLLGVHAVRLHRVVLRQDNKDISGFGVTAVTSIRHGFIITAYVGPVYTIQDLKSLNAPTSHLLSCTNDNSEIIWGISDPAAVAEYPYSCLGSFCNYAEDRGEVNCRIVVIPRGEHGETQAFVIAIRDISAEEPLLLNYGHRATHTHHTIPDQRLSGPTGRPAPKRRLI